MIAPRLPSRPCDSIPSLSSFISAESDRTNTGSLAPCYSSPSLPTRSQPSLTESDSDDRRVDSGFPATYTETDDGELDGIYEEEELGSDVSDLFGSSSNLVPATLSEEESIGTPDFHSIQTFDASASALDKLSGDGDLSFSYSPKKHRAHPKRKLSNWYQVSFYAFLDN